MYFMCFMYVILFSWQSKRQSLLFLILQRSKLWVKKLNTFLKVIQLAVEFGFEPEFFSTHIFNCCDDDQSSNYGLHIRIFRVSC